MSNSTLTDWCAPDTPCPDCTPCVVAPARPLIAMWADLAARIRCGWPDDRCPPGAVTVEATQQPPGSDCDAEVQVIPGGPAGADHAGVTTWGGRIVVLRPWAQINEAGQLTDAAQAQRLEAIARSPRRPPDHAAAHRRYGRAGAADRAALSSTASSG
jgi:hypothetical protein